MFIALFILIIPVLNFLFIGLMDDKLKPKTAGLLGIFGLTVVAALSYFTAFDYFFNYGKVDGMYQSFYEAFSWMKFTETLSIDLGILLDPISVMMLVVIVVIITQVVPVFTHIYEELGSGLSGTALVLMNISNVLNKYMQ